MPSLSQLVVAAIVLFSLVASPARADRRDDEIAAVKAKIADLDKTWDEEQERFQRQYTRMDRGSREAERLWDAHQARMKDIREQRVELDKRLAALSVPSVGEIRQGLREAEEIRQRIAQIDEQIAFERDRYMAYAARPGHSQREIREAEERCNEKVKALGAERYQLMKRLAAIKADAREDLKELREAMVGVEQELAEARARLESLEQRKQRLAAQIEMLERPKAMKGAEIRQKLAEVAKAQADEDAAYTEQAKRINIEKYRIYTALRTPGLSYREAAELRARMAEHERALEALNAEHTRKVAEFEQIRARLENELERVERGHH